MREKSALSEITKSPNLRTKPVLSKTTKSTIFPGKFPTYNSAPAPAIRLVDVRRTDCTDC
jgi:hypothetical protein